MTGATSREIYTSVLKERLDPSSRMLAAQDFCHAMQGQDKPIADYIRRLEKLFHIAYGREGMSSDARDTLLYSQMQMGMRFKLMEPPAVSGTADYKQLCVAARNEEKRFEKRCEYLRSQPTSPQSSTPDKLNTSQTRRESSDVNPRVQEIKGPPEMKRCLGKAVQPPE